MRQFTENRPWFRAGSNGAARAFVSPCGHCNSPLWYDAVRGSCRFCEYVQRAESEASEPEGPYLDLQGRLAPTSQSVHIHNQRRPGEALGAVRLTGIGIVELPETVLAHQFPARTSDGVCFSCIAVQT